MSYYPISGTRGMANHQPWDLMAQKQIEFQNSIVNRKSIRSKSWRKSQFRPAYSSRSPQGYPVPMIPGGHRWAHYCRPAELQAWRDHL